MARFFTFTLALWLGAIGSASWDASPAAAADEAEADSLRLQTQGWTVDSIRLSGTKRPGVRHLVASGRIAAPEADVWAVISRPPGEGPMWPSNREAILERMDADTQIVRYTLSVPFYRDRHFRIRSVADPRKGRFRFKMLPGYGNVRAIQGYWQVTSLGDSLTRVTYVLDTDPGIELIPRFIVSWATRSAIPRTFAFIARQARIHMRSGG